MYLIQLNDFEIQNPRKEHPEQIRDHQICRRAAYYIESADRHYDKDQQKDQDDQSRQRELQSEKYNTPGGVEQKLKSEEIKGGFNPFMIIAMSPDHAGGHTHKKI